MNDLKDMWQQESSGEDMLQQMLESKSFKKAHAQNPLVKLKKNLIMHIGYALVITLGYAWLIYTFAFWQVQACLILLIAFNLWAMHYAWKLYANIDLDLGKTNVLTELKNQYKAFSDWEKQNMRLALFIYPFAAAGGFMLGGSVGSGKTPEVFMDDYRIQIILVITIIILVPLSYLLAKWMSKVAFGRHIRALKEKIDELEQEG